MNLQLQVYIDNFIINDRVNANFSNMNTYDANAIRFVELIRLEFSIISWETSVLAKNIASPVGYNSSGICNSTQNMKNCLH